MSTAAAVWTYDVGDIPHKVTAFENALKDGTVYLRWRAASAKGRNWKHVSLGFSLRDERGRIVKDREREAMDRAQRQYALLLAGAPQKDQIEIAARRTLKDGWLAAIDKATGKYPVQTPHRKEVQAAMQYAMALWGADRPWDTIRRADLRALWRKRIEQLSAAGHPGHRGAVITVSRVLAVAQWLRDEELIPATACVPSKHWRQELAEDWRTITESRKDYTPARPRYSHAEMLALLKVAPTVDPRYGLLLALGAELRAGQVVRAWRSDLTLETGEFTIWSKGKKKGVTWLLTAGQLASARQALTEGYLRVLEAAGGDYPLFPQGQLTGGRSGDPRAVERHRTAKPVNARTLQAWTKAAEALAKIEHVDGRGLRGIRRRGVDEAEKAGISLRGLQEHGGWTDPQVPQGIYAEQHTREAREEARTVRARIRGESDGGSRTAQDRVHARDGDGAPGRARRGRTRRHR